MKSLWIHYKITMNSPHSSRLHYLFREFSLNSLSFSQIHLESTFFCIMTMNSLTASRFTVNTLSFSRIHYFFLQIFYEITICCAIFSFNSLFFFANSLSVTRVHFESTIWFGKPLWIRFEITMKRFWNHYEIAIFLAIFPLRDFTMNSLSVSRIHLESTFSPNQYERTICFAIPLWIHYHYCGFTMNTLLFSRIEFLFREFRMNSLPVPRLLFQFTICFGN